MKFLPGSLTFDNDMYSCDIESLYTSIPIEFGLEEIEYWIMSKRNLISQHFAKELILELTEFILKSSNFLFDSKMFSEIFGTAMGTKCAPHMPHHCLSRKN